MHVCVCVCTHPHPHPHTRSRSVRRHTTRDSHGHLCRVLVCKPLSQQPCCASPRTHVPVCVCKIHIYIYAYTYTCNIQIQIQIQIHVLYIYVYTYTYHKSPRREVLVVELQRALEVENSFFVLRLQRVVIPNDTAGLWTILFVRERLVRLICIYT